MGPRTRTRRTRKSSSRRRTLLKKHIKSPKNQDKSAENSPVKPCNDLENVENSSNSACSTPKAERYRIPEIQTCPPAPKKRRMSTSCSLRRTSIAFFAHPDIELFFNFALCGIPV